MKAISQRTKKVMDTLTGYMEGTNGHRKIDNTNGTFMTVHVERMNKCKLGQIYSVAHYFEQNGDLMRDPDMEFIKGADGEYYPISFWQDAPLKRDEAVEWGHDGEISGIKPKLQAALVAFSNTWMRNIKAQQDL